MIKLIGIAGKAGTGKDSAGYYLEDVWGYRSMAFADPLKHGLQEMLNLGDSQLWGDTKEEIIHDIGQSPRQLMQTLGDWGRSINPDMWTIMAGRILARMDSYITMGHAGIVITDVRYENEAAFVRDRGGIIIHIDRDDALPVYEHSSEQGISGSAYTDIALQNNGTLEQLYCKLADIMEDLDGDKHSKHDQLYCSARRCIA